MVHVVKYGCMYVCMYVCIVIIVFHVVLFCIREAAYLTLVVMLSGGRHLGACHYLG